MGKTMGFKCRNCGFEAEIGNEQPYFTMSGSLLDKYCPKTGKIVTVFTSLYDDTPKICCQDKEWQLEFGNSTLCRNCKGECLQDLEMLAASEESGVQGYKCPTCGNDLDMSCVVSISCID